MSRLVTRWALVLATVCAGCDAPVPILYAPRCAARVAAGGACTLDADCDDGCHCSGVERCEAGTCVAGTTPCDDGIACTLDTCDEATDACGAEPVSAMCADGDACNGAEMCDVRLGCTAGVPLSCDDGIDCTIDRCERALGCRHEAPDGDGDGHGDARCGGLDCDDARATVSPAATERCDDGIDDDCDGRIDHADLACRVPHDTCETARLLPGSGRYFATTYEARAVVSAPSCVPPYLSAAASTVFRVDLTAASDLTVSVDDAARPYHWIAVRPWDACNDAVDLGCVEPAGYTPRTLRALPPGSYAIVVAASVVGDFALDVTIAPPAPPPPVDRCEAGTLDASAGGRFVLSRYDLTNDFGPFCAGGADDVDAALRIHLDRTSDVRVSVPEGTPLFVEPHVALVSSCAPAGAPRLCGVARDLEARAVPAGDYFLVVELTADAPLIDTAIDLSISDARPIAEGDTCERALALSPGVTRRVELGDLTTDRAPDCAEGRDAFFELVTTEPRDITVEVATGDAAFTGIGLLGGCEARETIRCTSMFETGQRVTFRAVPAGRWIVPVWAGDAGSVEVVARTAPPTPVAAAERCDTAPTLLEGTTTLSLDDVVDDDMRLCGEDLTVPDAVLRFELTTRTRVRIDARALAPLGASVRLALHRDCEHREVRCGAAPGAIDETLEPGAWALVLESETLAIPLSRVELRTTLEAL